MTLDEAIKHCEEVAEELLSHVPYKIYNDDTWTEEQQKCVDCANEHKQLAKWLSELQELRELVIPIQDIPKDYCYDTETRHYYCYRHKYTGHEIHVNKETPIYTIDAVKEVISRIEQARDKDKNAGEYPYNRCIEIVREVLVDDTKHS